MHATYLDATKNSTSLDKTWLKGLQDAKAHEIAVTLLSDTR